MKVLLPLIFLFASLGVDAQARKFRWSTELCEFEGTYDARKYTLAKIKNTQWLLSYSDLRVSVLDAIVWKYEDIGKLDVAKVDAEHKRVKAELESLDYIRTKYTDRIRSQKLREADQRYALVRTTMLAYTKPAVIRDYAGAADCKAAYGEPIISGGDRLLAAWRRVNEESRAKNADPERLRRQFDQELASPDRLKFALVETMLFGWWNCALRFIDEADVNNTETPEKEFKKLFIRVRTIRCDEP